MSLDAIATALAVPVFWTHLVFLSEQHLPLKSPREMKAYLRTRKSIVATRRALDMIGGELADICNRFSARYRELPGVGCFAVEPAPLDEGMLHGIRHGSNWMILHRDHCCVLREAARRGDFERFRSIVHAEEIAIHSVLAHLGEEIQNFDATLVAYPHVTDNQSMVMTDELFRSAIGTDLLFIRKRPLVLSPFVRKFIVCNHFAALGGMSEEAEAPEAGEAPPGAPHPTDLYFDAARHYCAARSLEHIEVGCVDPRAHESVPKVHLLLSAPTMRPGLSVRVLSENLVDHKVCLVDEHVTDGAFEPARVEHGALYSTLRARLHGLFLCRDILPLAVPEGGFVTVPPGGSLDALFDVAMCVLAAGEALPPMSDRQDRSGQA